MDLMANLDRVILRAEILEENLLGSVNYLFEASTNEVINWIDNTKREVTILEKIIDDLAPLIEKLADDPRVIQLVSRNNEAIKQIERKKYLIEYIENRTHQLFKKNKLPKRLFQSISEDIDNTRLVNDGNLEWSLLERLNSI